MSHTKIEMDVMQMQLRTMTKLLELQEKQADALDRIAKQCEDLMAFLHGTTIEQVESKRREMKKKNKDFQKQVKVNVNGKPTKKGEKEVVLKKGDRIQVWPSSEVEELKDFVEKNTTPIEE